MENYKKEITVLHEKNMQSAINEKTAALKAGMESLQKENLRLNTESEQRKNDLTKVIIAAIIALITGCILAKIF